MSRLLRYGILAATFAAVLAPAPRAQGQQAASISAFPAGFTPFGMNMDGRIVLGNGTPAGQPAAPAYRWSDGAWMPLPAQILHVAMTGNHYVGPGLVNGVQGAHKVTISGTNVSTQYLDGVGSGYNGGVSSLLISPDGSRVVGTTRYGGPPPDINSYTRAAAWPGSSLTPLPIYDNSNGLDLITSEPVGITATSTWGVQTHFRYQGPLLYESSFDLVTWGGGVLSAGRYPQPVPLLSGDGSVAVLPTPTGFTFLQGTRAYTVPPLERGCQFNSLSYDGYVVTGGACVWRYDWQWTPLLELLEDQGVDITGWSDVIVTSPSGDGTTVVGQGTFNGEPRNFRAVLGRKPMRVALTTEPGVVDVGQAFTATMTVTNLLDTPITNVTPDLLVPTTGATGVVTGPTPDVVPTLAPGATAAFTIEMEGAGGYGYAALAAVVTAEGAGAAPLRARAGTIILVQEATLVAALAVPDTVALGATFDLTLTLANPTAQPIRDVWATAPPTITSPDGAVLAVVAAPPVSGSMDLAPGQSFPLTYTYRADAAGTVRAEATGRGTSVAGDPVQPATASLTFPVRPPLGLRATLVPEPAVPGQGAVGEDGILRISTVQDYRVRLTVENTGRATVQGIAPPVELTAAGGGASTQTAGPTPPGPVDLEPGATATFTYAFSPTAEGLRTFTATVSGQDALGTPVSSDEATAQVDISALVVTITFRTADGEVTEAASGRRRLLNEVGDWITAQRALLPGGVACISGCVDVEILVEDADGNPVEDAEVQLGATAVVGAGVVTPETDGGFFCDPDESAALPCGRPFEAPQTGADGISRAVYWFPGLILPDATTVTAVVDAPGYEIETGDAPLVLLPTQVDFGVSSVALTPEDATGLRNLEALRALVQLEDVLVNEGCKALGEFLNDKAGAPLDVAFLRAGKAATDYFCGKVLAITDGESNPRASAAQLIDVAKRATEFVELYWFYTAFNLRSAGTSTIVFESAGFPFLGIESDFVDAAFASFRKMALGPLLQGQAPTMSLELYEVSSRRASGSSTEDIPAVNFRFSTAGGAPVEHTALLKKGYSPDTWLSEDDLVTRVVGAGANAGQTTLATGDGARRSTAARRAVTGELAGRAASTFAVGQILTIDVGTPTEESVQVASVSGAQVGLTTPLRFDHAPGVPVTRVDSLSASAPDAPATFSRGSGVPGAGLTPTLRWLTRAPATAYDVAVATDSLFTDVIETYPALAADSVVVGPLAEGGTVYWRVRAAHLLGTGPWSQTYALVPSASPADALAGAVALPSTLPAEAGRWTVAATTELNEVASSCGTAIGSVWFDWTPEVNGRVVASADSSTFGAAVSVWTGAAHPLVEVACAAPVAGLPGTVPEPAAAEFYAEAGTAYHIRVAGPGAANGFAVLTVQPATDGPLPLLAVTTTANAGPGSLRQAILDANAGSGGRITFAIAGEGPHTIAPLSVLPYATKPLVIDGFTQAGSQPNTAAPWQPTNAVHQIIIDGSQAGSGAIGLELRGGQSAVRGLVVGRFGTHGVVFNGYDGNVLEGCAIGVTDSGTAFGNGYSGVWNYHSRGLRVGGPHPQSRNVISDNANYAVLIWGSGASETKVQGNFIGTAPDGLTALGNGRNGNRDAIFSGSTAFFNDFTSLQALDVVIGGTAPGEGNVISASSGFGVLLVGRAANQPTVSLGNTRVLGNRIGTTAAGTAALPNLAGVGVRRNVTGITIGGTEPGAANVISGNSYDGVYLEVSNGVGVAGNLLGTDVSGGAPLGNGDAGVTLACAKNASVLGNVIGGNGSVAVANGGVALTCPFAGFAGSGNRIAGNWIGTDRAATASLGNAGGGVIVGVRHGGETIGGPLAADGNTIAFNSGPGVLVRTTVTGPVAIRHNSLIGNAGIGIDLEPTGATANDPGDADTGPNNLQNSPALASATGNGAATLSLSYSVDTAPANATYPLTVDLYLADPDGEEGRTWLGADTLETAQAQTAVTATFTPASPVPNGAMLVATVTDADGRTSEMSASLAVVGSAGGATQLVVTGGPGWRMLSMPLTGSTVGTLASQNLVQGLPDLYPGAGANLFTGYDGTTFVAPALSTDALVPGRGMIWFLYDQDISIPGGPSQSNALPMTLTVAGPPPPPESVVPLHVVGEGWNLVGNPYPFPLDLSRLAAWAEGGALRSSVAQVWDPSAGATGSYALSSLLGDALQPWSGAFVQNSNAARLRVPATADAARGRADSTAVVHRLAFELSGETQDGSPLVDRALVAVFRDGAVDAWDTWDAGKLAPLGAPYVLAAFEGDLDGEITTQAQVSRPLAPETTVELPIAVEAIGTGTALTLTWPRLEVPALWHLTLTDMVTGATADLRKEGAYTFVVEPSPLTKNASGVAPTAASWRSRTDARLVLRVEPAGVVASSQDLPLAFKLSSISPNPSRGDGLVRVEIPTAAEVRVLVYDLLGREVAILADGERQPGRYALPLEATRLAAGVYVVRMTSGDFSAVRRLTVLR